MATTTATITISSTDLLSDELALSTTATASGTILENTLAESTFKISNET